MGYAYWGRARCFSDQWASARFGRIQASKEAVSQVSDEGKVDDEMKKVNILGVSLLAVLAFCAVSAGAAFAEETAQWLVSGASIALGTAVNVDISLHEAILLEDMNATLKPDILCTAIAKALGFVYSNGVDEIIEGECTAAETMTSGVTCVAPKPVDFPWLTELFETAAGVFLDRLLSDGKGAPGWEAECTAFGIKVNDVCKTESGAPPQENSTEEEVLSTFPENPEEIELADCTVGGEDQGLLAGSLLLKALSANGLELLSLAVSLGPVVE